MQDSSGFLWIGTGHGLCRFDKASEKFRCYKNEPENPHSLGQNRIHSVLEDGKKRLWVCTGGGGLNLFRRESETFERYTEKDGLPSNATYHALEDGRGRLWISTNKGISRFDPEAKTFKNYDHEDGLQGNEFNQSSAYKNKKGEMFFGGVNGLTIFHPEEVPDNPHAPDVVFTAFKKHDQEVRFKRSITTLKSLELSWQDRFIGFEFAALEFSEPEKNTYSYMLEGFDNDWISSGTKHSATYTNLDGGAYTLRVKAANNDGVWSDKEATLRLIVEPPPWRRWWAYTLYLLLIALTIAGFLRNQKRKLEHQELIARQEKRSADRLRKLDRLKDELRANTSHELRTPLNGIIGIAESIVEGAAGPLNHKQTLNLSLIVSSGRRLASLINDILDFSKLKNQDLNIRKKPVDMRQVVELVLTLSVPLIQSKNLKLVNDIPDDAPAVKGDENRLQQVLHNLIGNAIKFTEKGEVRVSAEQLDSSLLKITVSDTGIGIPPEKQGLIFQSFQQADGSTEREYGGTGLGLTIARQLVELHGGDLRVDSVPGEGSNFHIILPVSSQSAPALQKSVEITRMLPESDKVENATEETPDIKKDYRILVVDDEPVNLQVIVNQLGLRQYQALQAAGGPEALQILESVDKPDLILLDMMMPKMSGIEVCRRVREKYTMHELPIIFLTAKNQVKDLVDAFAAGGNDYLTKPFSSGELFARIQTHMLLSKTNAAFGRFVPHQFLNFLGKENILDLQLGDQVQAEMTVLFSDIRSFTTLSENMSPSENFEFINSYLGGMGPVIRKHGGFIDKYIGDGLMALFPHKPDDAIQAALEMRKRLDEFNRSRHDSGFGEINIGIGIHTGPLMLGTIGEAERMESTVISDAVNLASRLEEMTKVFGASIVASADTLRHTSGGAQSRYLGYIRVKGKKSVVKLHEILSENASEKLKAATLADFERSVNLYRDRKFAEALKPLERVLNENPEDMAAHFYRQRCEYYVKNGIPDDWSDSIEVNV